MTYQEYKKIFEQDVDGRYSNLIIPQHGSYPRLDLTDKTPLELTVDEIIRLKKYAAELFKQVDKKTIN
jgi:hypothetical protein